MTFSGRFLSIEIHPEAALSLKIDGKKVILFKSSFQIRKPVDSKAH